MGAKRSRNDAFKKGTASVNIAIVAQEDPGQEFPLDIISLSPKTQNVLYVDPNSIRRLTTEQSEACRREAWAKAKRRRYP
jgi:hypothetical protein